MATSRTTLSALGLAALAALRLATPPAAADTPLVGTFRGSDGQTLTGAGTPQGNGESLLMGDYGRTGYFADYDRFTVDGATFAGGKGGTTIGTAGATNVYSGPGGTGLSVGYSALVTVNSGTFTGGDGGAGGGVASDYRSGNSAYTGAIVGGPGGNGADVNSATMVINGGTFRGGASGDATGTATNVGSDYGGDGLNANYQSVVTINGGTFIGGQAGSGTDATGRRSDGAPVTAVEVSGGTVRIYGGTFTAGTFASPGPHNPALLYADYDLLVGQGSLTLYGSDFTVNGVANFSGVVPVGTGTITGRLQNNVAPTTFTYKIYDFVGGGDGTLTIVAAPEPSQVAALGLGVLSIAALTLKARKRKSAA